MLNIDMFAHLYRFSILYVVKQACEVLNEYLGSYYNKLYVLNYNLSKNYTYI